MTETRKTFQIRQPQDVRYSGHGSGGMFTARMEWDATAIETLNSGYLYDAEANLATYRIECRLIYEQEA